ncbi:TetR/AcrR family transcriptional regulator [Arundinibacter roseus]|uniref:TetR/AcrR family transcriptional regulator n=1 Tax=Arundinibacter roseus TaxID=2070510 RepID=A0A4V2X8M5_9BACT|nr:TetR/AcrR family transcriptional regulator [Arundinibacter roseus]TDB60385.1 TetR/AcrR family transcriptional regulator [Arundinibacter roseus]
MYNTKQKILEASVRLFNENGIDSVRLQQIAEEVGISVGNLAYHYKNKEAIIESVYEQVFEEFDQIFRNYLAAPTLHDFDNQVTNFYHFFTRNHFYLSEFFKASLTKSPQLQQWQTYVVKMMIQLRSRIQFFVMNGLMLPATQPGQYEQLAEQIWMSLVFYIPKCNMIGQPLELAHYKKSVWNLVQPHFTSEGTSEYTSTILPQLH